MCKEIIFLFSFFLFHFVIASILQYNLVKYGRKALSLTFNSMVKTRGTHYIKCIVPFARFY